MPTLLYTSDRAHTAVPWIWLTRPVLLKLVSSLPVCAEAVDGLTPCVSSLHSCPATSNIFLRRTIQKSLCEIFLSIAWRKNGYNCAKWPDRTVGKTAFCSLPSPMADWISISHSLMLFHMVITISSFISLPCSLHKFSFCGISWMLFSMQASLLSIYCTAVKPTPVPYLNVLSSHFDCISS